MMKHSNAFHKERKAKWQRVSEAVLQIVFYVLVAGAMVLLFEVGTR